MTSIRMAFRFFIAAMLLAGFALPGMAAAPDKTYSIRTTPSYNGSGSLSSGTNKAVVVTIRNETPPDATNSAFQAVKVWAPTGITAITGFDAIPGASISIGDLDRSITLKKVGPINPGAEFAFKIYVTVAVTSSCELSTLNWSGVNGNGTGTNAPVVRTGSALNGADFIPRPGSTFWYPMTGILGDCVMAFDPGPHGALAGGFIGPVTVKGSPASAFAGTNVTLTIDTLGATGGGPVMFTDDGTATFPSIKTADSATSGPHTLTATSAVAGVDPINATFAVTAKDGILRCPSIGSETETKFEATSGANSTSGKRDENKILDVCVAIPYDISFSNANKTVNIVWDELSQPNAVLETDTLWPFELAGADGLPRPTKYNVGDGTYWAGTCLSSIAPARLGTLGGALTATSGIPITNPATESSIAINFDAAPTKYPFPIIVASASGVPPERMLVKSADTTTLATNDYIVVRQAGSPGHPSDAMVASTPLPISSNVANGPVGLPVPVCIKEETYTTKAFNEAGCLELQTLGVEPRACFQTRSKLFIIGDVFIARD